MEKRSLGNHVRILSNQSQQYVNFSFFCVWRLAPFPSANVFLAPNFTVVCQANLLPLHRKIFSARQVSLHTGSPSHSCTSSNICGATLSSNHFSEQGKVMVQSLKDFILISIYGLYKLGFCCGLNKVQVFSRVSFGI